MGREQKRIAKKREANTIFECNKVVKKLRKISMVSRKRCKRISSTRCNNQ